MRHYQTTRATRPYVSRETSSPSALLPTLAQRFIRINLRDQIGVSVREKGATPRLYLDRQFFDNGEWRLQSSFGVGFRHAGDVARAIDGLLSDGEERIIQLAAQQRLSISIKSRYGAGILRIERRVPVDIGQESWQPVQLFSCNLQHAAAIAAAIDDLLAELAES